LQIGEFSALFQQRARHAIFASSARFPCCRQAITEAKLFLSSPNVLRKMCLQSAGKRAASGTALAHCPPGGSHMRFVKISIAAVAVVCLTVIQTDAGQRGNSGKHSPSQHPSSSHPSATHGPSSTTHGSKGSSAKSTTNTTTRT